ncbi:unnamed protein product [Parnassius mnemosyne]|uniref:Reverse transcriptase domain-containing protein n=1 Tax=Parnassius mnemosyne TaxID=213953 RepID=A0AAV1KKL0_9NEOP
MNPCPNYNIYQFPTDRHVKACILVRQKIGCTLGMSEYSSPNLCIVQIVIRGKKVFLISAYVEPRNDEINTINSLDFFLQNNPNSIHIIGGDFNGWHPLWGSVRANRRGNNIVNLITTNNLNICNIGTDPTFETVSHNIHRESIIDLTLTCNSPPNQISNWKITKECSPTSSHNGIIFELHMNKSSLTRAKKLSTFKYNTQNIKWDDIKEVFQKRISENLDLDINIEHLNTTELEKYVSKLTSVIQNVCNKLFPQKGEHAHRAPWWNEKLESLKQKVIKNHHKLQQLKRNKKPMTDALSEKDRLKNEYSQAIRAESTKHFKEFCNKQGKEDVWSVTNRLLKTTPLTKPPTTLKTKSGNYTSTTQETAETFLKEYFPEDEPDTNPQHTTIRRLSKKIPATLPEPPFTVDEIINAVSSMNPKKSPGLDHLTADICTNFIKLFPSVVTKLMNRCLQLSYFPKAWKVAYIKVIPKPNKSEHTTSSYRPIGLINVFGKVLEKLITKRLKHHLHITGTMSNMQFGFKEQTSTTNAIQKALDVIQDAKAKKLQVIAISLDIQSAFDNAWWPAIFHKLNTVHCPSNLFKLLQNYVKDRTVRLDFADSSCTKPMSRGCIQGSVCGPILWNLVLDELLTAELPQGCHLQAFADDILLITQSKDITTLENITNEALTRITLVLN